MIIKIVTWGIEFPTSPTAGFFCQVTYPGLIVGPFHLNSPKACQGQVTDSFNKNIYFCTVQNREGVFQHFAQKNFPNDIWIIKKKTPHVSELARLSLHAP